MSALMLWMCTLPGAAWASPWDIYGHGGTRMGRGGGGMALPANLDATVANPAALAGTERGEVGVGFVLGESRFLPYPSLYWDTNRDGRIDDTDPALDAQPEYEPVRGFFVGITRPFGDYVAGGLTAYVPMQHMLVLQSFEPSVPNYFLYGNRLQRYDFALELAVRPFAGLAIGGGLQVIPRARFSMAATLDATLGAGGEDTSMSELLALGLDVHELEFEVVPGYAPNVALHWDAGKAVPALDGLYLGAAWRGSAGLPVDVDIDLQINAGTGEIGDIDPIVVPLLLGLQIGIYDHYQPSQLSLGAAWRIEDALTLSGDLRRTDWDRMEIQITRVLDASVDGALVDLSGLTVEDGNPYLVDMQATWSTRFGADLAFPRIPAGERLGDLRVVTRGGLGYEPSPLVSQTADTALLDADRLLFAVGLGLEHDDPLARKSRNRVHWDAFFQYHLLASGELDRGTPATPTPGFAIDGHAIPIGGHLYAAGLAWRSEY